MTAVPVGSGDVAGRVEGCRTIRARPAGRADALVLTARLETRI